MLYRGRVQGTSVLAELAARRIGMDTEDLDFVRKGRGPELALAYLRFASSDAPVEFHVTLLPKAAQPNVIHGSKAVGEPPLMLAFSVREALRDAVSAYGKPGGEVRLASPATGEAIFTAIQQRQKENR